MRSMWSNSCCSIASYEGRKGLCFAMTLWPHLRLEELAWAWHRSAWWMHLLGVCQSKWVSSLTFYALLLVSVRSLGVYLDYFEWFHRNVIILVEFLYWGLWGGVLGCMDITFPGPMCCYCCFMRYFKLRWVNHFFEICRRAQMHVLFIANVVLAEDWSWRPWSPQMWTVNNFVSRRWQPNSSLGSLLFTDWEAHLGLLSILPVIPINCRPHPFRQDVSLWICGEFAVQPT